MNIIYPGITNKYETNIQVIVSFAINHNQRRRGATATNCRGLIDYMCRVTSSASYANFINFSLGRYVSETALSVQINVTCAIQLLTILVH